MKTYSDEQFKGTSPLKALFVRVPAAIDIPAVLRKAGLEESPVNVESLAFVCESLLNSAANHRGLFNAEANPYVPLCASILEDVVKNYRPFISALAGIVESDNRFILGEKCTGYRFVPEIWKEGLKFYTITNWTLRKAIKKSRQHKEKVPYGYNHLNKWWNKELEFDCQAASSEVAREMEIIDLQIALLESQLNDQSTLPEHQSLLSQKGKLIYSQMAVEKCHYPYRFHIDGTVNRLHTNMTNLKKCYRKFFTYNGQKMIAVDLKNSQPYLLLALFQPEFWSKDTTNQAITLRKIDQELYNGTKRRRYKQTNHKTLSNQPNNKKPLYNTIITLSKSLQTQAGKESDLNKFIEIVTSGQLYETLLAEFRAKGETDLTRDKVKMRVLMVLFGKAKSRFSPDYKAFKHIFPSVITLIEAVKAIDETLLPRILQRLESYLILQVVTKEISKARPDIPLFTIHDSIVTTAGNERYVSDEMNRLMAKYIGNAPTLDISHFTPPTMVNVQLWKPIEGYEGLYEISKSGEVRSLHKGSRDHLLKGRVGKPGYNYLILSKGGKRKTFYTHRLLANAFIPNPSNKCCINHKNGDKTDNRLSNLEWATMSENTQHAYDSGLIKSPASKRLIVDLDTGSMFWGIKQAAKARNITYSTVKNMLNGNNRNTSSLRNVLLDIANIQQYLR